MHNQPAETKKLSYDRAMARQYSQMVDPTIFVTIRDWALLESSPIEAILLVQNPYPVATVAAALTSGISVEELLTQGVVRLLAGDKVKALPSAWQTYVDPVDTIRRNAVVQSLFGPEVGLPYYLIQRIP